MSRFKQFIDESFNKVQPYELTRDTSTTKLYTFNIGPLEYLVSFNRGSIDNEESEWECVFRFITESDDEAKFKITNTGNQMLIFATVIEIMRNFIKKFNSLILLIEFTADKNEPSRVKLYNHLCSKFKSEFPEFIFKRVGTATAVHYVIERDY